MVRRLEPAIHLAKSVATIHNKILTAEYRYFALHHSTHEPT